MMMMMMRLKYDDLNVLMLCEEEAEPCAASGRRVLTSHQQTNQHASDLIISQVSTTPDTSISKQHGLSIELTIYVSFDTKQVISETFFPANLLA